MSFRNQVNQVFLSVILNWIREGKIAIPQIQRMFVWTPERVVELIDTLYWGIETGTIVAWKSPNVTLKDGSSSDGKKIIIDGQQRITAISTAIAKVAARRNNGTIERIKVAFNPKKEEFAATSGANKNDPEWIADIAVIFEGPEEAHSAANAYLQANPGCDVVKVLAAFKKLGDIVNYQFHYTELSEHLSMKEVHRQFVRLNQKPKIVAPSELALSTIAAHEEYQGQYIARLIELFPDMLANPQACQQAAANDPEFAKTTLFNEAKWACRSHASVYRPNAQDVLRVTAVVGLGEGKVDDAIEVLVGKGPNSEASCEGRKKEAFAKITKSACDFANEHNFHGFNLALRSAGFVRSDLSTSSSASNFAYALFLLAGRQGITGVKRDRLIRRWYAMTLLTKYYSNSFDTTYSKDLRLIGRIGIEAFVNKKIETRMTEGFWNEDLPQKLMVKNRRSSYFACFIAAHVFMQDRAFLSGDHSVESLLHQKLNTHHIYSQAYLESMGVPKDQRDDLANFAIMHADDNNALSDRAPHAYLPAIAEACDHGVVLHGSISDRSVLMANCDAHAIPLELLDGSVLDYDAFRERRRPRMALKMQTWFNKL